MSLLEIRDICMDFGGLRAIDTLSLKIEQGQILGLIGPNGAGKSTAFNCVAGVYKPTSGSIWFDGKNITGAKPWDLCRMGLARTFQIVKPFASKTVLYNVMVGAFARTDSTDEAEAIAAVADDAIGAQTPESHTVHGMAADLVSAIAIAVMKHKMILRGEAAPMMRTNWPGTQPSRWATAGRVRQTNTWTPRGK